MYDEFLIFCYIKRRDMKKSLIASFLILCFENLGALIFQVGYFQELCVCYAAICKQTCFVNHRYRGYGRTPLDGNSDNYSIKSNNYNRDQDCCKQERFFLYPAKILT